MKHNGTKPDRKPYAKSFLLRWNTMEPSRIGNHTQKVSYWDETQWNHAGQETIRKKFPIDKKRSGAKPDRKPYENSFLLKWNAVESRWIGNYRRPVSCGQETLWCHTALSFRGSEAKSRNLSALCWRLLWLRAWHVMFYSLLSSQKPKIRNSPAHKYKSKNRKTWDETNKALNFSL